MTDDNIDNLVKEGEKGRIVKDGVKDPFEIKDNTTALEESITVQIGSNTPINTSNSVNIIYPKLNIGKMTRKLSCKKKLFSKKIVLEVG